MSEVIDVIVKSTEENPAPYPILFEIPQQIPEITDMLGAIHMNYSQLK